MNGPARTTFAARSAAPPTRGTAAAGGAADDATLEARIDALVARVDTPEDEALERQREAFDLATRARAEQERELNALRDMAMEQMKQDDEILKKWIALI